MTFGGLLLTYIIHFGSHEATNAEPQTRNLKGSDRKLTGGLHYAGTLPFASELTEFRARATD